MYRWKTIVQQALSMIRGHQVLKFVEKYSWVVDDEVAFQIKNVTGKEVKITWPQHSEIIDVFLDGNDRKWQQMRNLLSSNPDNIANYPPNYYEVYAELCIVQGQDNEFLNTLIKHNCIMLPGTIYNLLNLYMRNAGLSAIRDAILIKMVSQEDDMINILFDD